MGIDAPQWLLPAYLRSVKAVGGTASVEAIREAGERLVVMCPVRTGVSTI